MKSAIDYMKPLGPNAGPYGRDIADRCGHKLFEKMLSSGMHGGSAFDCGNKDYIVGIYAGNTGYSVVSAYNLGLDEQTDEHKGYFILEYACVSDLEVAFTAAARFVSNIKNKDFAVFKHYPFEREKLPTDL